MQQDDLLIKISEEIAAYHRKIIDDWCKAYLAEIYQDKGSINPGDFTLVEQENRDYNKEYIRKYWFERKDRNYPRWRDAIIDPPSNGLSCLAICRTGYNITYVNYMKKWFRDVIYQCVYIKGEFIIDSNYYPLKATHWIPLPELPEEFKK